MRKLLGDQDLRDLGITYERSYRCQLIKKGLFPKPVKPAGRRGKNYWIADEINSWISDRIAARDGAEAA